MLAGLSSIASLYAGMENSKSVEDAIAQNIARLMDENATREKLFHEARGASGNAVLPEYFGDTEASLAGSVTENYQRMMNQGSAAERQQFYNQLMAKYRPIMDAGDDTMAGIYDGTLRSERMGNLQPVLDARTSAAEAQTTAYDRAMAETQAQIRGEQASKGFIGGGTTQNRMLLGSNVGNAQRIAELMSGANYQNEVDKLRVNDEDVNLRLSSMPLISRQARDSAALENLPIEAESNRLGAAMAPFNFFRLPYDRFEPTPGNNSVPVPSTGAMVGDGISQFINTYSDSLGSQAFIDQLGKYLQSPDAMGQGGTLDFGKLFESIGGIINPAGGAATPGTTTPGTTAPATPGVTTTPPPSGSGIDLTSGSSYPGTYKPSYPLPVPSIFDPRDRSNQAQMFNVGWPTSGGSPWNVNFGGLFNWGGNTGSTGAPRFIFEIP